MKLNMGTADRIVRLLVVAIIAVLYFTHTISGTLALVLGVFAVIFLLTSFVSWCPIYAALGLSTRKGAAPPAA